jgi:hypothetical protein
MSTNSVQQALAAKAAGSSTQPQAAPAQPAPAAPSQQDDQSPESGDSSTMPDESGVAVKVQGAFSKMTEAIAKLFDESGVRRSFTIPYIEKQEMAEHISAVGKAAKQSGGLSSNLIVTSHHSSGKGWGSGEGHTVGYPGDKLRSTIIPKNDPNAKAAIDAAQSLLNKIQSLIGDDPVVVAANSQLKLLKKNYGADMNLLDLGIGLIQITFRPMQSLARAHSGTKPGGHSPQLRAPHNPSAEQNHQS